MYSIVAASIYIPTNSAGGTSSLCPFINCKFFFFDDGYSDQCNVIPHWSFNFHFSNTEQYWASLHVFVSIYIFSLEKCLFRYSVHFLLDCLLFWYWDTWVTCLFWRLILCHLLHWSWQNVFCVYFALNFIVSGFTIRYLIYFQFIFLYVLWIVLILFLYM